MWEEIEKDWQRLQSESQPPSEDVIADVRQRANRLSRQLFFRDLSEIGAAGFVVIAFTFLAISTNSMLAMAGSILIIIHAVVASVILLAGRRVGGKHHPGDPPATEFRRQVRGVEAQITLLQRVLWWYILPGNIGVLLVFMGLVDSAWMLTFLSLGLVLFSTWVWWINQRAVQRGLIPWRDHLRTIIRQLEENGESGKN